MCVLVFNPYLPAGAVLTQGYLPSPPLYSVQRDFNKTAHLVGRGRQTLIQFHAALLHHCCDYSTACTYFTESHLCVAVD